MKNKPRAIAMLKNCDSVEHISQTLGIHTAIIQEWKEGMSEKDLIGLETNTLAADKAVQILSNEDASRQNLQEGLMNVALVLVDEMKYAKDDVMAARAINLTASSVSILYKTFFNDGPDIVVNNNTANVSNEELSKFQGVLRK